jgi:channel protein (hemolysin III family)
MFVPIAGTCAPFALLALHGPLAVGILVVVWPGALGGPVVKLAGSARPAG